jgi:uroporphyrinogen-III decarboxylase
MMNNPEILRELLERLTDALIVYVCHQIDSGAQVGTPCCAILASVL